MISNNYIPEKINDANAYLDGTRMIGVAASVDLPEINMKTGTVEGFGIGGEVDSPTIGQWESFEQAVQFNTLYSSAVDMLSPMSVVNLTFRAAQQVYDKSGGYDFKGLRVVEMARVKKFKPGKIEKSEGMEAEVTVEVTYIMIEVDGEQLMANTCPQTKEQKMQRQKARSEIANAKPKGKRQVKASQGNTSYGKMVKQDKPFVKKQNTHTEQKPTAK